LLPGVSVTGVAGQMLMLVPSSIGLVNTPDLRKRQYWKGVSCWKGGSWSGGIASSSRVGGKRCYPLTWENGAGTDLLV
jgi:hypothetical protein